MVQIPITLVIALMAIVTALWPGVASWSETSSLHHALTHGLYLLAGALVGLQIAWWTRVTARDSFSSTKDHEVIS